MRKNPPARVHSAPGDLLRAFSGQRQDTTAFFAACVYTGVKRKRGGRRYETTPLCDPDHAHYAAAVPGCACGADARQRKHRTNGKTSCIAGGFPSVSKDLVEFRRRSGERKSKHFLRRHVRRRKYFSACKRALCPPRADRECAAVRPQTLCQKVILFDSIKKPPAVQEVFSYTSVFRTDPRPRSRAGLPAGRGCA